LELGPLIAVGRTAEVYALGEDRVLKLMRSEMPRQIGEWEARAGGVVASSGLRAPRLLETVWVDDRFGLVYERLHGPSMLQVLQANPLRTGRLAAEFARLHAEMHAVSADGTGLPDLKASMRGMIERSASIPPDLRDAAFDRLDGLPDGNAILHYDMHPGNVIMTAAGPRAIDWMSVQRGDPAADIARTIFLIRDTGFIPGTSRVERAALFAARRWFLRSYLDAYRRQAILDEPAVRAWRPVVLAARLGEDIVEERPKLIKALRSGLDA
jgi:uncharacterized protein (TIGR02172 family)